MEEASYDMTEHAMSDQGRYRGDENLFVQFYMGHVEDREKSLKEGRPIFRDAEFVRIIVPGDKNNIVEREVRDQDKHRFADRYRAFKNNEQQVLEGTPLEEWGYVSSAQREELKFFGIRTVEQLASVSDSNAQKFMGINLLRQKAQEFIDASAEGAPAAQLQALLDERDAVISEQNQTIQDLIERVEKLESEE